MKIAVVKSNFYPDITLNLLNGATQEFFNRGGKDHDIHVYDVPGAFEVPSAVSKILSDSNTTFDAIVTLGVLIKGETDHYEHISRSVTDRISELSVDASVPIIHGILTVHNLKQAVARSDPQKNNKGAEVMAAAIDMINCFKKIK